MEEDLKAMRDQIRRLERRYLITMVLVIATAVSYLLKYQSAMNDINQIGRNYQSGIRENQSSTGKYQSGNQRGYSGKCPDICSVSRSAG